MKPMNFPGRRDERRSLALRNATARARLTDDEQILLLAHRPGESLKEIKRLRARIESFWGNKEAGDGEKPASDKPARKSDRGDQGRQHLERKSPKPKRHRRGGPPGNARG